MLEEFFRNESGEELHSLDIVNEKKTEKVEEDGKGNMIDCMRREQSVEGSVKKSWKHQSVQSMPNVTEM